MRYIPIIATIPIICLLAGCDPLGGSEDKSDHDRSELSSVSSEELTEIAIGATNSTVVVGDVNITITPEAAKGELIDRGEW